MLMFATGSVTVTTVPHGWLGAARMMPPCSATILYEIASPRPVPRALVVKNGSNICAAVSASMPVPWSAISTRRNWLDRSRSRRMWKSVSMRVLMAMVSRPSPTAAPAGHRLAARCAAR